MIHFCCSLIFQRKTKKLIFVWAWYIFGIVVYFGCKKKCLFFFASKILTFSHKILFVNQQLYQKKLTDWLQIKLWTVYFLVKKSKLFRNIWSEHSLCTAKNTKFLKQNVNEICNQRISRKPKFVKISLSIWRLDCNLKPSAKKLKKTLASILYPFL